MLDSSQLQQHQIFGTKFAQNYPNDGEVQILRPNLPQKILIKRTLKK